MKKIEILSLLLVLVMLLTSTINTSMDTFAISPTIPTLTVSSSEGNPGNQVTVTIALSNNPGICSIRLAVNYDSDLTLTAVDNGGIMSDCVFGKQLTANPYFVTWDESVADTDNTKNGTLVTLTFEISESAEVGDLPVSVSYRSGEIFNLELDNVDFTVVNGNITVKPVPIASIELDKAEVEFDKGGTLQLTATVLPENATDKTVIWESADETIATVDSSGLITGVKRGTTTVTAKSEDATVQAVCTVTIRCIHEQKTAHSEKDSTCVERGNDAYYTCDDCGKIFGADGITELEVLPLRPFGNHTGGTATCQSLAVCSVCGNTYGEYDSANHNGEAEMRNAKEATCCEDGYTGDTYCKDCNTKIASGFVIPATGHHADADGQWETDETRHWHTCYYGTQFDIASHSGGVATCAEKASCSVCGVEYGVYAKHTLTHHDRIEPDYENDGNIEYWTCDECGKYFSDSNGNGEISADGVMIAKLVITEYQFLDGEVIIEASDGAIPEGSIFDVQKIVPPPAEIVEKVKEQMAAFSEVLAYYEIRLFDADEALMTHLDGEITIKIQFPARYVGGSCIHIAQEDSTGKLIEMVSWWEGEYLCYKTDWLEMYH